ncbi:MAG TPA: glycosyltransferase family 4 protein [Phycisphaerae bacterium]|nr:glycosyltransferase family 4 protein [Phycisphaerae bacterium]
MRAPLRFQPTEVRAAFGHEFDVLIFGADLHVVSYVVASVLARICGKKVIHWGHTLGKGTPQRDWKWSIRRQVMRLADGVLLYGEREREALARLGMRMDKVLVAPNALDTRQARLLRGALTESMLAHFRGQKGLVGRRILLYVGRLLPEKRVTQLVEAMPHLRRRVPDAKLVIIGDGPERDMIAKLIKRLDTTGAVDMVGAVFDEQELALYFMCAELAVSAGGIGLMVNHAFAYGVPVLTSDNLWIHGPEVAMIRPGVTGMFFRDQQPSSLAACAATLMNDPAKRAQMRQACIRMIDGRYNEKAMARAFDDAVRYVLEH